MRRNLILVVALTLACAVVAATSQAKTSAAKFKPPNLKGQTVRVMTTEGAGDEVVLYHAEDVLRGWGATVNHVEVESTSSVVGGMAAGQTDVAAISPVAGLNAIAAGVNMKAFAINEPRTDDVFVSKPSITSMAQVKGAVVGVNSIHDISGLETGMGLGSAQLKISDVKIVEAGGQGVRTAAFLAGRLDAGPISLDNYQTALQPAGFHLLYNYMTQAPGLVHDLLWATPSWISGHQQLATAFNEALLLSYRWFDNPKSRAQFIQLGTSKLQGETAASMGATYDEYAKNNFFPPNSILTKATLTGIEQLSSTYNLISSFVPESQWLDNTYAVQALKAVGKVSSKKKKG